MSSGDGGSGDMKDILLSMGFEEEVVRSAVEKTLAVGGTIEDAMGMILTPELYSFTTDQPPVNETTSQQDVTTNTNQIPMTLVSSFQQQESLKLILVIRSDLKMSTGKIAAQCVHAAIGVLDGISSSGQMDNVRNWKMSGEATICLKCSGQEEMMALLVAAQSRGLPSHIVQDAGRTEVSPGSKTVLAIGPGLVSHIDAVTGHLKLL